MTVATITCDACLRLRRCLHISTKTGHEIDVCKPCLLEAMAAFDDASARRLRTERMAMSRRLRDAREASRLPR